MLEETQGSIFKNLIQRYLRLSSWQAMVFYMAVLVGYGLYALSEPLQQLKIILIIVIVGMVFDYLLHRWQKTGRNRFPLSGLISSLILVILLPTSISVLEAIVAILIAIASKHFLLFRKRHIFNPAAFGAAASVILFGLPLGWRADSYVWLVILLGLGNIYRVRKYWQVSSFLMVYLILLHTLGGLSRINIFTFYAIPWFFILFMLPEPVTSLYGKRNEIIFGSVVAGMTFVFTYFPFFSEGALLWGLLTGNLLRFFLQNLLD